MVSVRAEHRIDPFRKLAQPELNGEGGSFQDTAHSGRLQIRSASLKPVSFLAPRFPLFTARANDERNQVFL